MFCDEAGIHIKAGEGGSGCISFHTEKYVPKGPPDGGDGGKGGDIIFKVNTNLNTLHNFFTKKHFNSEVGRDGRKNNMTGADGEDLILEVPLGTQIYDEKLEELLADLSHPDDVLFAAKGGKGGLGNARFVGSVNQAPRIAERGEPGEERDIHLELKLVADVAIIGLPNAGKSTLISAISNARPKVADYPFTTLIPNLGVVKVGTDTLVVCDIPGLIKDAHKGKGLGDKFLRHIERCKVLVHLIDANSKDPAYDYRQIREELAFHSESLSNKKEVIAISKIDTIDEEWGEFLKQELEKEGIKEVFSLSAVAQKGIDKLLYKVAELVKKENSAIEEELKEERSKGKATIFRPHLSSMRMSNFEVVNEKKELRVRGNRVEQLIVMTDFQQIDAERRIYNILKKAGILKALKKAGAKDGDFFWVGRKRLAYMDWDFDNKKKRQ